MAYDETIYKPSRLPMSEDGLRDMGLFALCAVAHGHVSGAADSDLADEDLVVIVGYLCRRHASWGSAILSSAQYDAAVRHLVLVTIADGQRYLRRREVEYHPTPLGPTSLLVEDAEATMVTLDKAGVSATPAAGLARSITSWLRGLTPKLTD